MTFTITIGKERYTDLAKEDAAELLKSKLGGK